MFETFVEVGGSYRGVVVPEFGENLDGLQYLEGKEMDYINKTANEATREAHIAGGVPVLEIVMPDIDERSLGGLIYFFEMSCALSGFTLGVNPFNQPGVEQAKNYTYALMGRAGYEESAKSFIMTGLPLSFASPIFMISSTPVGSVLNSWRIFQRPSASSFAISSATAASSPMVTTEE